MSVERVYEGWLASDERGLVSVVRASLARLVKREYVRVDS